MKITFYADGFGTFNTELNGSDVDVRNIGQLPTEMAIRNLFYTAQCETIKALRREYIKTQERCGIVASAWDPVRFDIPQDIER